MIKWVKNTTCLLTLAVSLSSGATTSSVKSVSIPLEPGNLVSIIDPRRNEGKRADEAWQRYSTVAIKLAQSHGYQNRAVLRVTDTLNEDLQEGTPPGIFVIATWPDEASDKRFESLPGWAEYKALRPVIWHTLNFYKSPTRDASEITLRDGYLYTLAFNWDQQGTLLPASPPLKGGSVVHQMQRPRFVSHSAKFDGPEHVVLMEWQSEADLQAYAEQLEGNNAKMNVYRVAPVIR